MMKLNLTNFRRPVYTNLISFVWLFWIFTAFFIPCLCPQAICEEVTTVKVSDTEPTSSCCDSEPTESKEPTPPIHSCEHSTSMVAKGMHLNQFHLDVELLTLEAIDDATLEIQIADLNELQITYLTNIHLTSPPLWGRTLPLLS